MKRILFILFLLSLAVLAKAQFRMVGTVSGSWTTVNDSTYTGTVNFQSDLTGQGYLATQIADTFKLFTPTEQLYRIDSVWNTTFSAATMRLIRTNGAGAPVGQVLVFNPDGRQTIPNAPFGSTGATAQMNAAVDAWNARVEAADGYLPADLAQGDKIVDGNGNALQFGNLKEFKTENFISIPTLDSLYDIPYPVTQASSRVWTECIVVYDNILYWVPGSSGDTLRIYDLNSEDQPVLLSAEITGVGGSQPVLRYDNKRLYVGNAGQASGAGDAPIIDVSDPRNPIRYSVPTGTGWSIPFDVKNGIVYAWGDRNSSTGDGRNIYTLDVRDLNNLSSPVYMDTLTITAFSGGGEDQLHVSGDNLYAVMNYTTTNDSFEIFKIGIENPDSLYLKSSKRFVGEGGFILSAVRDDFIYLVDNADTLEIYDFRGDTLKLVSKTNIPFDASGPSAFAKLQGNYLYVSHVGGYIDVVDVTDISNPFAIGRYPTIGNHRGSTVWGDRYVAGSRNNGAGVRVHKIGISKHPVVSAGTILSGEGRIDRLKSKNINSETILTDNLILDKAKNAPLLSTDAQGKIYPRQLTDVADGYFGNDLENGTASYIANGALTIQNLSNLFMQGDTLADSLRIQTGFNPSGRTLYHRYVNAYNNNIWHGLFGNATDGVILRANGAGLKLQTTKIVNGTPVNNYSPVVQIGEGGLLDFAPYALPQDTPTQGQVIVAESDTSSSWRQMRGIIVDDTDANGDVILTHNYGVTSVFTATIQANSCQIATVVSNTNNTTTFRVFNCDGTAVTNDSVTIHWVAGLGQSN